MFPKRQGWRVGRGQDSGKVPGTSVNMNTVHHRGLRFKCMRLCKARYVCKRVSSSPVGKGRYRARSPKWKVLTHVGSCPAMLGNSGVWRKGGSGEQVKSEGAKQINSRKGADSQVNRLPATHAKGLRSHTQPHARETSESSHARAARARSHGPDPRGQTLHSSPSTRILCLWGWGSQRGRVSDARTPPLTHTQPQLRKGAGPLAHSARGISGGAPSGAASRSPGTIGPGRGGAPPRSPF